MTGIAVSSSNASAGSAVDHSALANWIIRQQYVNPHLPSYGAFKTSPDPAVYATNGAYYGVSPYFANLAVLGLLRTKAPGSAQAADRWIHWYFAHLNSQAAPDGVPDEHFYHADGTGETICAKPGGHFLCNYDDATDSAAATFLSVLWAAKKAGTSPALSNFVAQKKPIESLAAVLLKLQQPDGLCWSKADYHVKYLEDNCEVFAGLRDFANLEQEEFHDPQRETVFQNAALRVQQGILRELYDSHSHLFRIAKFRKSPGIAPDLDKWYPDTQAQFWPILFGVVDSTGSRARAMISIVDAHWNGQAKPNWSVHPERVNDRWIESGAALGALLAGDTNGVQIYIKSIQRLKIHGANPPEFVPPFNIADAGWLLQIIDRLSN